MSASGPRLPEAGDQRDGRHHDEQRRHAAGPRPADGREEGALHELHAPRRPRRHGHGEGVVPQRAEALQRHDGGESAPRRGAGSPHRQADRDPRAERGGVRPGRVAVRRGRRQRPAADAGSSLSLDEYLDRQNREFLLKVRPKKHHNRPCYFPWYYIHVNPDGTVFPCGSWWEHTSFGDFKTQTFVEIWTGAKFKGLRKQLYHMELRQTCANCDVSNMGRPDVKASFAQRGAGPPAGAAGGGPPRLRLRHSTPRHALSASFHLQSRRSHGARPRCRLGTGGRTGPAAALGT